MRGNGESREKRRVSGAKNGERHKKRGKQSEERQVTKREGGGRKR